MTTKVVGRFSAISASPILSPEILKKVDDKSIAFNPAVELSYLPKEVQKTLLEAMEMQQCTPSLSQAQRLKALHQQGTLELDMILKILGFFGWC